MNVMRYSLIGGAIACLAAAAPLQADPLKAEVMHWWTSAGQAKAANVLKEAFNAAGGEWIDNATPTGGNARTIGLGRMAGGNPPTVMLLNGGLEIFDLADQGFLNNLDEQAKDMGWRDFMPAKVFAAIENGGHIWGMPINVQTWNYIWYDNRVFDKLGLKAPTTWDEFFAVGDKLKAAGMIPLAFGAQEWQETQLWTGVLAGAGGRDVYMKIYRDKDVNAVHSDEFIHAATIYKKLRDYMDDGITDRSFNEAASMVITGKAGMQIMGDWGKAEYLAAGWTPGKELGCSIGVGQQNYILDSSVFVMPKKDSDPDFKKAQDLMIQTDLSKEVQIKFNALKGSAPVRLDLNPDDLDYCTRVGLDVLKDPEKQLPNPLWLASSDMVNTLGDTVTEYFSNPDETPEAFADKFANVLSEFQ